jgi:threonine dehydrogenase-like Zn-dependent dehydrogenase
MTTNTMLAARLHKPDSPLSLDEVPMPEPTGSDVVVAVKACNIVPNLANVLSSYWTRVMTNLPLPKLPAIFGLDVAGVVAEVGEHVYGINPGDRVYVNPARGCGSCRACRSGQLLNCESFIYQGYFGRGPLSQKIFARYPYGGLAEYTLAPVGALVKLPDNISFEEASRFGYTGTGYGALATAGVRHASKVLINGATGTLGVSTVLAALAMGATHVLGVARNQELLRRVKAIAPERIDVLSVTNGASVEEWAKALTDGEGVDAVIDCLPPRVTADAQFAAMRALRMGGKWVDVGGVSDELKIPPYYMKNRNLTLTAGRWFTTEQGAEMAEMVRAGTLDMSAFEHRRYPLAKVNEAISALTQGDGGFTNFVVIP